MYSVEESSNSTLYEEHPTLREYYSNLSPFIVYAIFTSVLITILNVAIFSTTRSNLKRQINQKFHQLTTFLCFVYVIISIAATTVILIPKSWLICHTIMHLSFTFGAVAFHKLCFKYVDSEMILLKETDCAVVNIQTPPCCCCCFCLPKIVPTKMKLLLLRYMIWQMPFIQGTIMIVLNWFYYNERIMYLNVSHYFAPFIVSSILTGMWGLNIMVRMINKVVEEYNIMRKLLCLQLIILLCKLQFILLNVQLDSISLSDNNHPMNHTIHKQTIINLLILAEMTLVSLLAQNAYRVPIDVNLEIN